MTSEAPQDVAALPQTEALDILDVIDGIVDDTHPEGDGCPLCTALDDLRELLEREAAAGLLDQNDRLRSALRYLWGAELPIAAAIRAQQDVGDAMTVRDVFVHGIEGDPLVTDIDAALSSGRGSGAEEAARNE